MKEAEKEMEDVAKKLESSGHPDDAKEVARLSQLIDDVAKGDLSTSELSNAIDDVKSEVPKLRDAGLNDLTLTLTLIGGAEATGCWPQ